MLMRTQKRLPSYACLPLPGSLTIKRVYTESLYSSYQTNSRWLVFWITMVDMLVSKFRVVLLKYMFICLLKGLDKGTEPPPPPPAEEPRTPSDEERAQSVELEIQGLNSSQVGLYFLFFVCMGYWPCVRSKWLDIGKIVLCVSMGWDGPGDGVKVHKDPKGLLYFLVKHSANPERVRKRHLARSGSQSQDLVYLRLPYNKKISLLQGRDKVRVHKTPRKLAYSLAKAKLHCKFIKLSILFTT